MVDMDTILIEQAVYGGHGGGGYRFLARSPGFRDEWLPQAERLCAGFGERPAGVACPGCVFAQRFGRRHVAVVQVADQGADDAGRPGALGFRLLVLGRPAYEALRGDPFLIADQFPAPWHARGELPTLTWDAGPPPPRTVEQVQEVLKREDDGPDLLGGAQVLVDGGRLVFQRPAPDTELLRGLWALLPTCTRCELWPASFAFGNALGFHALVLPRPPGEDCASHHTQEQAGEYPEGRYELSLQLAAEDGDQEGLDALFARRSRAQVFRLGVGILVALIVLPLLVNGLAPGPPAPPADVLARLDLPPPEEFRPLSPEEQERLRGRLDELAQKVGVEAPRPPTPEGLLAAIDQKLGTPDARRDPGPLHALGPAKRQLRALLWKHGLVEYRDVRYNPEELVERLGNKVAP